MIAAAKADRTAQVADDAVKIEAALQEVHRYYKFGRHSTAFLQKPYFLFSHCAHLLFALWVAEQDHPIGLFAEDAGLAAFLDRLDFGPLRYLDYRRRMLYTGAYEEDLKNEPLWFKFWGKTLQELQGAPPTGPKEFARQFLACITEGKPLEGRLARKRHKALADLVQGPEAGRFCLHSIWILEDLISAVSSYVAAQPPAVYATEQMQSLACLLSQLRRNIIWETVAEGPYALLSDATWGAPSALARLRCGKTPGRLRVAPRDEGGQVTCTYTWHCGSQRHECSWTREIAALPQSYEETLFKTWPYDRQEHTPDHNGAVETHPRWIIRALEAGNLEAISRKVDAVLERLVTNPACESLVEHVADTVRNGRSEWTAGELPWLYIKELDHLVGTLKFACREAKVLGGEHPAETVIANLWPPRQAPAERTDAYEPRELAPQQEGIEEQHTADAIPQQSQPVEFREQEEEPAAPSRTATEPRVPQEQAAETSPPVESPESPGNVDTREPVTLPAASEFYAPDEGPTMEEPTESAAGAQQHPCEPAPCLSEPPTQPSETPDRQQRSEQAVDKLERMMTALLRDDAGSHSAEHKPDRRRATRSARATNRNSGQAAAQILTRRLLARHGDPTGQDRSTPISSKQLQLDLGWSRAKVQRVMTQVFGSRPFQTYRQACREEAICTLLARLDADGTDTPENEIPRENTGWMMRPPHPATD